MTPLITAIVRPRARRRRIALAVGVALAVTVSLVGPLSPAQAKKVYPSTNDIQAAKSKAEQTRAAVTRLTDAIVSADNQMEALQTSAEQAAEAYNAAESKLQDAQATAASAERAATNANRELADSRVQLGEFAAASYRSGGDIANVGALLTADGPGTLMDRANTLSQLGAQREYVLQRVESARVVAELLNQQAQGALTNVTAATAVVRTAQQKAAKAVSAQAAQVAALNTQKTSLRHQLQQLDSKAAALAESRAAGLRAEAARKAAAAAKVNSARIPSNAPGGSSIGTAAGGLKAVAFAKKQLGSWYLWGGAGPARFDCSGLTLRAWQQGGVQIPRVASWQYAASEKISTSQLRPGDLLFYATDLNNWQTIHHVGLYVGSGQMIEAPHTGAQVRYASIWRSDLIGAARP